MPYVVPVIQIRIQKVPREYMDGHSSDLTSGVSVVYCNGYQDTGQSFRYSLYSKVDEDRSSLRHIHWVGRKVKESRNTTDVSTVSEMESIADTQLAGSSHTYLFGGRL